MYYSVTIRESLFHVNTFRFSATHLLTSLPKEAVFTVKQGRFITLDTNFFEHDN